MSNEWLVREVVKRVNEIEKVVNEGGESGLCELRELWVWLGENDEKGVFDGMKLVGMFSENVRRVLLCGFIENFCE